MRRRRRRLLRAALTAVLVGALSAPAAAAKEPVGTSARGLALIEHFEGYFPTRYLDPVGVVTQCYGATGVELLSLPPIATRAQCRAQLIRSLDRRYEPAVRALKLGSQNRFDATVSIAYNVGTGILSRGRSLGDALRGRNWPKAAAAFGLYVYAGGRVFPGLVRRREAERKLFLTPDPRSAVVPPLTRVETKINRGVIAPKGSGHSRRYWCDRNAAQRTTLRRLAVRRGWAAQHGGARYQRLAKRWTASCR